MFHQNIFKILLLITANKGKRSCSLPLEMLSHFSPLFDLRRKYGAGSFAVCGRRQGLPALDPASWSQLDRSSAFGSKLISVGFAFSLLTAIKKCCIIIKV